MSVTGEVLRLGPEVKSLGMLDLHNDSQSGWSERLAYYLVTPEDYEPGTILLTSTYRLEEVEEVIEPEKPGAPVEPYVGLSWVCPRGYRRFVVSCTTSHYEVISEEIEKPVWTSNMCLVGDYDWWNYPRTPSTPAVTRKVKKWVKITDSPEC